MSALKKTVTVHFVHSNRKPSGKCEFFENRLQYMEKQVILFFMNQKCGGDPAARRGFCRKNREKYMKAQISFQWIKILFGAVFFSIGTVLPVYGAEDGSFATVTEESQIQPLEDGSGKYLLKSDGFYCLTADGKKDTVPAVHYFDHLEIDGTVLNGYYYHDAQGRFTAGNGGMVHLSKITCGETVFDGFFMTQNLGKMSAASQIRYLDNEVIDNVTFNGFYYFNENGRLVMENGIHQLSMSCSGQMFEGSYYFGGENGALVQEAGMTPEGLPMDASGKVVNVDELGIDTLEPQLESMIAGYSGIWSIYVKDLGTGDEILLNDQPLYSASLIKTFALAATYDNMENVRISEGKRINSSPESDATATKLNDLLWNMIAVSDNESYNEIVRLQTDSHDFLQGAELINEYLEEEGYAETSVQSSLSPSSTQPVSLGGKNTTSVKDCGRLLERIFKGQCVSREASAKMLDLLLDQECTWKIPAGLPENIRVANKTGETDTDQHDIAIVYGPKSTYILCVMSQECPQDDAIDNIRSISRTVYNYLNLQ